MNHSDFIQVTRRRPVKPGNKNRSPGTTTYTRKKECENHLRFGPFAPPEEIGKRLKSMRIKGVIKTAHEIGISPASLYNIENGKIKHPGIYMLGMLCAYYKINLMDLITCQKQKEDTIEPKSARCREPDICEKAE